MKMEEYRAIWIRSGLSREMFHSFARTFPTLKMMEDRPIKSSLYYTRTYMAKSVHFHIMPNLRPNILRTSVLQYSSKPTARGIIHRKINQILESDYGILENTSLSVTVGSPRNKRQFLVLPEGDFQVMQSKSGKALTDLYKIDKRITLTDEEMQVGLEEAIGDFEIVSPSKVKEGRKIILIGPRYFYAVRGGV